MILSYYCNIHHYNLNNTISQVYLDMFLLGMGLVLSLGRFHHTSDLLDKLCSTVTFLDCYNIQEYNLSNTISHVYLGMFLLGMGLVLFLGQKDHKSDLLDKLCSSVILLDCFNIQEYKTNNTVLQIYLDVFLLGMEQVFSLGHHTSVLLDKVGI